MKTDVLKGTGMVFDIQRGSLHDGPGIRTSVFLKGCPLRCKWCHNPESWKAAPELLLHEARCIRCGKCIAACPQQAISFDKEYPATNPETCRNCGACISVCCSQAREMAGRYIRMDE